jgi:hypothetical protein
MAMQPESVRSIIIRAGGHKRLAEKLNRTRQTIYMWQQVPVSHVRQVAKLARMKLADIRPDVFGK